MVSQDIILHFPLIRNKAEQTQERASASLFRKSSLFIPWPIYQLNCTTSSLFLGTPYILDIKYTDPLPRKCSCSIHVFFTSPRAFPWKRVFYGVLNFARMLLNCDSNLRCFPPLRLEQTSSLPLEHAFHRFHI